LLDHEIAYILLRDEKPGHHPRPVARRCDDHSGALDDTGVARAAQPGPVFSVDGEGFLHMRYTARTISIEWRGDAATAGRRCGPGAHPGQANTLDPARTAGTRHGPGLQQRAARSFGFHRNAEHRRLLYRARYHERISGNVVPMQS
jgi:hypothetical protein